jgi:hypothetical protein
VAAAACIMRALQRCSWRAAWPRTASLGRGTWLRKHARYGSRSTPTPQSSWCPDPCWVTSDEARAFKRLQAKHSWERVGLLSSAWHLPRIMRLAKKEACSEPRWVVTGADASTFFIGRTVCRRGRAFGGLTWRSGNS